MPSANDPVVHLYGGRLGNGPTDLTTKNRYPSSESGNGHEVKVEVHNHVHNHEKHSGATTVHHRDDFVKPQPVVNDYRTTNRYSTHNDNRSYSTNNDNRSYSTTNTTGQDHSAELAELKSRVSDLTPPKYTGGSPDAYNAERNKWVQQHAPKVGGPTEHPSISDEPEQAQAIERNRNISNMQFDPARQYRM